jgi:hypothetical protein
MQCFKLRPLLVLLSILAGNAVCGNAAYGQGTLNVALQQQFAFTGCSTAANVCGTPLIGGLLYFYQVGTTATRQDSFADPGLQNLNPWPLTLDANGRVPMFYLASGSVHVRLTDASGVVQFDYPSMLVIGPSGTGGGGGFTPAAGTLAATGDVKFRLTKEIPAGWLILNGTTMGNSGSGAQSASTANHDLYVYLYVNCPDTVCTVPGRTGISSGTGNADFGPIGGGAGLPMTLPDMRARSPVGFDDMGASARNFIVSANFANASFFPGPPGATGTTQFGHGGETIHNLTTGELPSYALSAATTITDSRTWAVQGSGTAGSTFAGLSGAGGISLPAVPTGTITASTSVNSLGGNLGHNLMPPFMLGTWLIKQ